MNIEELVATYLDRREQEGLSAEDFCAEWVQGMPGDREAHSEELALAIEQTLAALTLFEPLPRDLDASVEAGAGTGTGAPHRQLGEWELLRELGRGGMGIVFEARRAGHPDEPHVALKMLPMAGLRGERSLQRFRREAEVLSRLDDSSIVAARDFGTDGDTPYLVMELIEGRPLNELAGDLTERRAAALVATLARAVHGAHASGVLHRDIKPGNVIVRPDGEPVLLDFGLTASDADTEESLTSTGDLLGTPRYMAPEQARGRTVTAAADVWALGAVLYELVTGGPAFPQDSRHDVLEAVADGRWRRARVARSADVPRGPDVRATISPMISPVISPALDRVLRHAMAWRPTRRYPDAATLADDLERLARGEPVRARPPGPLARLVDAGTRRPMSTLIAVSTIALLTTLAIFVVHPWWLEQESARRADRERRLDHAVAHWVRGRNEAAATLVQRVLAEAQDSPAARLLLADTSGRDHAADALLAPDGPLDPLRPLADALTARRAGDPGRARSAWQRALETDTVRPWLSAWLRVGLADAASSAGAWHEAEAALVEASQRLPRSKAVAQELARVYRARRKLADAEREWRRALELDGDDPHLWHELARALFLQKDKDALALDAVHEAARRFETDDRSNANLEAALLDRMGRHAEAQAVFRRLLEQYPDELGYRYNLAFSLATEGRDAEALPLYRQVLKAEPSHLAATLSLAWLLTTTADDALRDPDTAEALLLGALQRDQGRSPELVGTIEEFARRTGRSTALADLLGQLATDGELDGRRVRLARAHELVSAAVFESSPGNQLVR